MLANCGSQVGAYGRSQVGSSTGAILAIFDGYLWHSDCEFGKRAGVEATGGGECHTAVVNTPSRVGGGDKVAQCRNCRVVASEDPVVRLAALWLCEPERQTTTLGLSL